MFSPRLRPTAHAALRCLLLAALATCAFAQKFYTYIGNLNASSVLIAWGTADGANTIGRSSPSKGEATVRIANREFSTRQNWTVAGDLKPDTEYSYKIELGGKTAGEGSVRTWAAKDTKLVFFVIGDYGTGERAQYSIAEAMWNQFEKRKAAGNPVRFVITTGDNIYADFRTRFFGIKGSGSDDADWANKFFEPYQRLLAHIPFYPSLGNHDGNETERHGDLRAYLDNFFFPDDKPARYYNFQYADLAEFFALDSTLNTESGTARPAYLENQPQFQWMRQAVPASRLPWKIPYYHHPVFDAGPGHNPSYRDLLHWIRLFQSAGVKVVFNGHEHNFQVSQANGTSGGARYIVSGAGGELAGGNVQSRMNGANIAAAAMQNHFLDVEIDGKTMSITPLGYEPIAVRDSSGNTVPLPLKITIP